MKKHITQYLQEAIPTLEAIYLFGSYADGSFTPKSDIDIAFLAAKPIETLSRWALLQELAQKLKKEVDLVDLRSASTVMQFQVVSTGNRIFAADNKAIEWWELKVYQLYLTLNNDRKSILEAIHQSGSIYGR